jgi:hypothetical protein
MEQPIELRHLSHAADERRDAAEPRFGGGDIMDRERHEQLMVLVEGAQDIALNIIDLQQTLILGGRQSCLLRLDLLRRLWLALRL